MNRHAWLFAFFTAAIALPAACTFPDVTFEPSGSSSSGSGANGGGSSTTRSTTSNGGNASTQNTGGTGQGGLGGAGGQGNGGASATSAGGSGGGEPCPQAADPCDCDNDMHRRPDCPGDGSKPADDCADHDARAFPGQTKFFSTPIMGAVELGTQPYDFNCDGFETQEWPDEITCSIGINCNVAEGWNSANIPACGMPGTIIKCKNLCSKTTVGMTHQPCN